MSDADQGQPAAKSAIANWQTGNAREALLKEALLTEYEMLERLEKVNTDFERIFSDGANSLSGKVLKMIQDSNTVIEHAKTAINGYRTHVISDIDKHAEGILDAYKEALAEHAAKLTCDQLKPEAAKTVRASLVALETYLANPESPLNIKLAQAGLGVERMSAVWANNEDNVRALQVVIAQERARSLVKTSVAAAAGCFLGGLVLVAVMKTAGWLVPVGQINQLSEKIDQLQVVAQPIGKGKK